MAEEKLKPCPFCGSDNLGYQPVLGGYVHCPICRTAGPSPVAGESAVEMWNKASRLEKKHEG